MIPNEIYDYFKNNPCMMCKSNIDLDELINSVYNEGRSHFTYGWCENDPSHFSSEIHWKDPKVIWLARRIFTIIDGDPNHIMYEHTINIHYYNGKVTYNKIESKELLKEDDERSEGNFLELNLPGDVFDLNNFSAKKMASRLKTVLLFQ